jgi:predicted transposase YdaD
MNLSPAYHQRIEETLQQGVQQGLQRGEYLLVMRQLTRRFGELPPAIESQIKAMPTATLEALAEALLDFSDRSDLDNWLAQH